MKTRNVSLGKHNASGTHPVRFVGQSHNQLIMHMQALMMVHQPLLVCGRPARNNKR